MINPTMSLITAGFMAFVWAGVVLFGVALTVAIAFIVEGGRDDARPPR